MLIDMDVACWIAVRWCGGCGVVALVWCGLSVGVGVVPVGCRWCWCWVVWAGWCALFGHGEAPGWAQTRARVLGRVSNEVFYGAVQGSGEAVGHGDGHAFDGT